ncbi:hypothetical protein Vadar_024757 [Vaccinium darrowii]|uniref:Uncharacterized protein n=1 Tax=Vaccinium darrowii TaxID=229202 RepID=A0ACB7Y8L4_9ERIC|nr:hypothetical protein Vadar_024757 [Vaccinium darrowii]
MATLSAAFQQQQSPARNSFAREDDNGGFEDEYENPFAVDRPQRRGPVAQANSRRWESGFKLDIPEFKGLISQLKLHRRLAWAIRSSADGGGLNPSPKNNSSRGTRLIRAVQAIRLKLSARIKEIRKNFPMKLLFLLVGFYCATVFATVIGQTGDWDILSAALSVAVVEGIGALTYRASLPLFSKVRSLITMFNYWKAGLSLGLFLDSFKYEMEHAIGLSNPFCFHIPCILVEEDQVSLSYLRAPVVSVIVEQIVSSIEQI